MRIRRHYDAPNAHFSNEKLIYLIKSICSFVYHLQRNCQRFKYSIMIYFFRISILNIINPYFDQGIHLDFDNKIWYVPVKQIV